MQLVDCLQSTNATQRKQKKLQEEILMIKRPKTTRLIQLGGKYFERKQFGSFGIRSSEGSYSNVSRLQLAQKVQQNEDTRNKKLQSRSKSMQPLQCCSLLLAQKVHENEVTRTISAD